MKVLFSEHQSNYSTYVYNYAIWAFPEEGESPADIMNQGFLPASLRLDRFYLCRNVRVDLTQFSSSSENRRIKRKGEGITCRLLKKEDFDFSESRRDFCHQYAKVKWGEGVMDYDRLDRVLASDVITDILVFEEDGKEIGYVTMYTERKKAAYYYYSFYDLSHSFRSLGMFMMLSALDLFQAAEFTHIYLGTCYSKTALYKTQFAGLEFMNGRAWSSNIQELKFMVAREAEAKAEKHLLDTQEYVDEFYDGDLAKIARNSGISVKIV